MTLPGFNIIARHLARIDKKLNEIHEGQAVILKKLSCEERPLLTLPGYVQLPCADLEDITKLEERICAVDEHAKKLVSTFIWQLKAMLVFC